MRFLAVMACVALVSGAAAGQQAPGPNKADAEMLCVFDNIPAADARLLVEAVVNRKTGDDAKIKAALDKAHDGCGKKYSWSDDLHFAAEEVAIGGLVSGVLASELGRIGFKDTNKLEAILDGLSDEDYRIVVTGEYDKNAALKPRLTKMVKDAGVPEKDRGVELAVLMIETTAITDDAMNAWDHFKSGKGAQAAPAAPAAPQPRN